MKMTPPAVTAGPPMAGELQLSGMKKPYCWDAPTGRRHFTSPVCASSATSSPKGGFQHGMPNQFRATSRRMPYGAPCCGAKPDSLPESLSAFL
jgi:hypothetical protein